ncbi:MAG: DUF6445 family protein [Pseudomonadota bacterium]
MVSPTLLRINPDAQITLHEISDGRFCAVVDNALQDPRGLVDYAIQHTDAFTSSPMAPGPRLYLAEDSLSELHRYIRSKLSRHFPFFRSGIGLYACLSNVTLPPDKLQPLQRLCHSDSRMNSSTHIYAGLIYLFDNPDLGGTAFYRWKRPDVIEQADRLFTTNPDAAVEFLTRSSAMFQQPPAYITSSNDLAELLFVVPAKFNRLVFYDGVAPHSGHIENPQLLDDDLSKGRLTFNFFSVVRLK